MTENLMIVVIGVMAIIFVGLGIYLVVMDVKLSRLEKQQKITEDLLRLKQ
ncbi:hypothetical protein MASR1M74_24230 [Lentimicrobium sp.]